MEKQEFERQLSAVREEIDRIDKQLLPLFLERMNCSEKVAEIKQQAGIPVLNAKREQEILDRVREEAGGYGGSAAALYSAIMAVSRARQPQMLVGGGELRRLEQTADRSMKQSDVRAVCQGVPGAYSHRAALRFFEAPELVFRSTWKEVFETVKSGEADFGVLPVENSAAGSVSAVYDLILRYRFYIVGAVGIKVEHCLAACRGNADIKTDISHPQGLSQCSDYIEQHGLSTVEYSNTAAAAKFVAQERPDGTAAICSEEAAEEYGLIVLKKGIQNAANNKTRFVIISQKPVLPENADKISLCFSLPHITGSLYNVLERFAIHGLNLTKIESRPIPGSNFEYDFYLDFSGNIHTPDTLDLICALHDELPRFSFLGNYREA